jgi:hypothetical protein
VKIHILTVFRHFQTTFIQNIEGQQTIYRNNNFLTFLYYQLSVFLYSTSKPIQKLRLAAETPQYLGITDLCRTYHLRSSVLFSFFCFWDENI